LAGTCRPCGFTPSAEQSVVARRGGRAGWFIARRAFETRAAWTRWLNAVEQTKFPSSSIDLVRVGPGEPDGHAHDRSDHSERRRFNPPPEVGHAPSRSFGAVFRYPQDWLGPSRDLAGKRLVLPSGRCTAALMGFAC
jgi:hypothetical protein